MRVRVWLVAVAFGSAGLAVLVGTSGGHERTQVPSRHQVLPPSASKPSASQARPDPAVLPTAPTRLDLLRAVEALGDALVSGETQRIESARVACRALGADVLPTIAVYLAAPRPPAVQLGFARFLREYRERAAFEGLAVIAEQTPAGEAHAELRDELARALPVCGGHGALSLMLDLLAKPEWLGQRESLASAVVAVAYAMDAARIREALTHPDLAPIRERILAALERRSRDLARDVSAAMPDDADPEAARCGVQALERSAAGGDALALERLAQSLHGRAPVADPGIRANLWAALVRLSREPAAREGAARALDAAVAGGVPESDRIALAEALALFGTADDRPLLDRLAQPPSPRFDDARRFFETRLAAAESAAR